MPINFTFRLCFKAFLFLCRKVFNLLKSCLELFPKWIFNVTNTRNVYIFMRWALWLWVDPLLRIFFFKTSVFFVFRLKELWIVGLRSHLCDLGLRKLIFWFEQTVFLFAKFQRQSKWGSNDLNYSDPLSNALSWIKGFARLPNFFFFVLQKQFTENFQIV